MSTREARRAADPRYTHEHDDWADGDCLKCQRAEERELQHRPEWVRRAQARNLPAKDTTGQAY